MIYNVVSLLQVFLHLALLKIPTSVRVRTALFCHFKIHTVLLLPANAMNKLGRH
jgi:hypothetical protein